MWTHVWTFCAIVRIQFAEINSIVNKQEEEEKKSNETTSANQKSWNIKNILIS